MIEALFALALALAVPVGVELSVHVLAEAGTDEPRPLRPRRRVLLVVVIGLAIAAFGLPRGSAAGLLVVPWLVAATANAIGAAAIVARELSRPRRDVAPWRLGVVAALGFLTVGAVWAVIDRLGLQPFAFDRTIVLLTAVHFHVAGFLLTLAGSLAARRRPGVAGTVALAALVAGTPLTALGFFGMPAASWTGALLVAAAGLAIGAATIRIGLTRPHAPTHGLLVLGGATLFVTMPLAAAYATGQTFGIAILDVPAVAATHGVLNVVGFAIPTMIGWAAERR